MRGARSQSARVTVGVRHATKVVMGWGAVPVGMWPGWAHGDPYRDRRYTDRWAIEMLTRRDELMRVAGR